MFIRYRNAKGQFIRADKAQSQKKIASELVQFQEARYGKGGLVRKRVTKSFGIVPGFFDSEKKLSRILLDAKREGLLTRSYPEKTAKPAKPSKLPKPVPYDYGDDFVTGGISEPELDPLEKKWDDLNDLDENLRLLDRLDDTDKILDDEFDEKMFSCLRCAVEDSDKMDDKFYAARLKQFKTSKPEPKPKPKPKKQPRDSKGRFISRKKKKR